MSIEYTHEMTVGWRMRQSDIPDYEERAWDDWADLEELAKEASELLDKGVWTDSLCAIEDACSGDTQIAGVPMPYDMLPIDRLPEATERLAALAKDVYRQVMRDKEPADGPYLISWTQAM